MRFREARVLLISRFISAGVLAALLSAGCASTYRDKTLDAPGAPTAAVLIQKFGTVSDFILYKIDDHNRPAGFMKRFELVPGEHTLTVGLNEGLYSGSRMKIHFDAKPGETYELNAAMKMKFLSGTWHTWITEVSTGKQFDGEMIKGRHDS